MPGDLTSAKPKCPTARWADVEDTSDEAIVDTTVKDAAPAHAMEGTPTGESSVAAGDSHGRDFAATCVIVDVTVKKKKVSKSTKEAVKRQIARLVVDIDSLEQCDEHGEEIEANRLRRSELMFQLEELGVY